MIVQQDGESSEPSPRRSSPRTSGSVIQSLPSRLRVSTLCPTCQRGEGDAANPAGELTECVGLNLLHEALQVRWFLHPCFLYSIHPSQPQSRALRERGSLGKDAPRATPLSPSSHPAASNLVLSSPNNLPAAIGESVQVSRERRGGEGRTHLSYSPLATSRDRRAAWSSS